jgi:hypothetical protein
MMKIKAEFLLMILEDGDVPSGFVSLTMIWSKIVV